MKYTDLNRLGGIGANSCLIQLGNFNFLVDAGLHPKEVGAPALPDFSKLKGVDLDFIVLTHCHLDHLGSLPVIARQFREVPIFMSLPSKMLAGRMVRNSVNVMKRQRKEKGIPEYPLYTFTDIGIMEQQFHPLRFERPEILSKGNEELAITLYPSGHVAGAASILIEHPERTIFLTGDVLFDDLETLAGARVPDMRVDVMITETTRGLTARCSDRNRESEWQRLFERITETVARGGSCLIPVFALGRMQEIMAVLNLARKKNQIPRCPVYAAGLGMDIIDYFDQISRDTDLIKFRKKIVKDLHVESPRLPKKPGFEKLPQGIYILSSGMMVERTPSYAAASCLLNSELNSVLFVGYCDPDTPGGKLRMCNKGDKFSFDVYELETEVLADIDVFDLSGHADREELLDLIAEFEPEQVILTHGDPDARAWFAEQIKKEQLVECVIDPQALETYTL